jgi:hypothetical protein
MVDGEGHGFADPDAAAAVTVVAPGHLACPVRRPVVRGRQQRPPVDSDPGERRLDAQRRQVLCTPGQKVPDPNWEKTCWRPSAETTR